MNRLRIALALGALILVSVGMMVAFQPKTIIAGDVNEADIKRIVSEYIDNNGGQIQEAINRYENELQMAAVADAIRDYNPSFGPKNAPVTIVEFSEYQCPFCRRVQETMMELRKRYDGRVRFVYKHFPLESIHPKARDAARASQAAHEQGKFWEYSEKMWERQEFVGEKLYVEIAQELGLDMDKFNKARNSERVNKIVTEDIADGSRAGVRGTPFFLINGAPLSGAVPLDNFVQIIEQAFVASTAK